jgi:hypothetical protein
MPVPGTLEQITMDQLLPGVSDDRCPPAVVADSRTAIRRARMRAVVVDLMQIALMAMVDYFVVHYPRTHVPFASRHDSLLMVAAANALMVAYLCLARLMPRWRARRMAGTWQPSERSRFRDRG